MSIVTPCRAACKNVGGICSGCHRTINEITGWAARPAAQITAIMAQLSGKETTHTCPSCGQSAHCDISAGQSTCWCFELEKRDTDALQELTSEKLCLCRRCLSKQPIA